MKVNLKEALAETKYFSILMDGSTDCAVVESELMYVIYVDKYGNLTQSFMKLKKVHDATAAGLTELLKDTMAEIIPGLGTNTIYSRVWCRWCKCEHGCKERYSS